MNSARSKLIKLVKSRGAIAKEIQDYNFRYYFVRRAKEDVEKYEANESLEVTPEMIEEQEKQVKQMERIKIVHNSIYL